ncbi:MAG: YkvA family protein [Pleomorphochaeta sp.]
MLEKKENKKSIELATKLGENASLENIENMEVKLPTMKRGPVKKIWSKVVDIYNGFMSEETPKGLKILLIGSLLYLVLPIDIVPDFIPVGGLLDDVTVLTYVWTKLSKIMKLGGKIGKVVVKESLNDKVQESIKKGYEKAFEFAKNKLEQLLKRKAKNTVKNCIINLSFFVIAIIFLRSNTHESSLISSLIILVLFIRTLYSVIRNIPTVFRLIKIYFKEKNIDSTIAVYMKNTYAFIAPVEEFKNRITILNDIPDLQELVKLQRKALNKTIIEVALTIVIALILAFVFKRVLIQYSSYNFLELISLPFRILFNI